MNVAYVIGIGPEGLREATDAEKEAIAETAGRQLFGAGVSGVLSIVIGLGILASVSAYLLAGSRICYAMARDGLYPSYAARLSARNAPVRAILTLSLSSIALLWGSYIIQGAADAFQELLKFTTVGLVLLTSLAVTSVFVLRRRTAEAEKFRVPFYPLPPLLYLAITGGLMFYAAQADPLGTLWGILGVLSGGVVWGVSRLTQR